MPRGNAFDLKESQKMNKYARGLLPLLLLLAPPLKAQSPVYSLSVSTNSNRSAAVALNGAV
jgi:hypothetical protein